MGLSHLKITMRRFAGDQKLPYVQWSWLAMSQLCQSCHLSEYESAETMTFLHFDELSLLLSLF